MSQLYHTKPTVKNNLYIRLGCRIIIVLISIKHVSFTDSEILNHFVQYMDIPKVLINECNGLPGNTIVFCMQ